MGFFSVGNKCLKALPKVDFVLNHIGVLVSVTGFALSFEFDFSEGIMIFMLCLDMLMTAIGLIFAGGTVTWNFCGFLCRGCKRQTDKGGDCCGIICCAVWVCVAELGLFFWGLVCGINMSAQYDPNNNERWKHVADATCAGWSPQSWEQGDTDPTGTASCLNATHRCEPVDADSMWDACTPGGPTVECWEYTDPFVFSISILFSLFSLMCSYRDVCCNKEARPSETAPSSTKMATARA